MDLLLAQLAPRTGDVAANVQRMREVLATKPADLAIFPELYLSGYRVGDRIHRLALAPEDETLRALRSIAKKWKGAIAVGAPRRSPLRPGEVENTVLLVRPDGSIDWQVKRYLPTYGPFEEGVFYTPAEQSRPLTVGSHPVGFEICYDAFFPEVSRELGMNGAELIVNISASPITSRPLFEKLLPARAVENGCPVVYVNRVGVEDGVVFGGGSGVWDARGESVPTTPVRVPRLGREERVIRATLDLTEVARWRPFRPVLRDVGSRPPPSKNALSS
jgi:predicted amidohydrolase